MPQFSYKARKRSGEVVTGVLDVADRSIALLQIDRLGLFPVLVEGAKGGSAPADKGEAKTARGLALPAFLTNRKKRTRKPKLQELATFAQQLANLLNAGMPLTSALQSMSHLETKGIPGEISRQLRQDVMEGKSLSDSMGKQPVVFTDLMVNMVRAGEQAGALADVLKRLGEHYGRFAEVQSKFKSAMIYPAMVATVGLGIIIFFIGFMLPKFMAVFSDMKIELPMPTRILMGISDFVRDYWWVLLAVIGTGVLLFMRFKATPAGRRRLDEFQLGAPVFGKVIQLNIFGQFARVLSTLLTNGVPLLNALKITEAIMGNVVIKEAIVKTREGVTDGKSLAVPLEQSKVFPRLMIDLIRIGEDTGDVPGSLRNVAETYENDLQMALRVMMNLIEPVMIISMALMVGLLLYAVLTAMFKITQGLQQ